MPPVRSTAHRPPTAESERHAERHAAPLPLAASTYSFTPTPPPSLEAAQQNVTCVLPITVSGG